MTPTQEQKVAREIVRDAFGQEPTQTPFPVGHGVVNHVYGTQVGGRTLVVRFSSDEGAAGEHQKEAWCIQQATAAGIPGPEVHALGTLSGTSYMIQTYLEGIKGEEAPSLGPHVWQELGRYARLSHSIPVQGYGGHLADAGRGLFSNAHTATWAAFIDYNIASLSANDALLELGVYTTRQRGEIASLFDSLKTEAFQFGLCHNDLKPGNTIISPNGEVALLDWGSAMVHIVPHMDVAEILRWQDPEGQHVRSFLEGYGLSWTEFKALLPQVEALQLIGAFDLVRWAIDRRPARVAECAARAKRLLERTLYGLPWEADHESVQP